MQQITRKLMITLVLLMTAAAGAWATEPKVYSGPVAITSLQVGDILAPGFSLTGDNNNYIHFDGGRHKYGGTPSTEETTKKLGDIVSINTLCVIKTNDNKEITPSDENENDVYAWKVTQVSSSGIWLSGIYYPAAIPTANANEWSMVMPAGNVLLTVAYKDRATMALTYDGTAITTEANAVTVFKGCEQEFAEALTPAVQNIEPTFNSGTAQDVTTTLAADFTFKSSDAGIIGFKTGETYADEGTLDQMEFRALTTTPVTLTVTYKGTDDLESKSQALLVTIEKKTYAITLADGTEDAGNWSIEPKEGLSEGDQVTIQYSGRLKVKSVKATSDAVPAYAANEYNEADWDYGDKKVIFTKQTAASVTAVTNSDTDVTWGDGWYTVSGNVTINGKVTLSAHTHLILQDGATLTINGQLNAGYDLYIYGQMEGTGKLNVTCNDNAIEGSRGMTTHIHGGEITATATGDSHHGLYFGKIMMYSGKLTATAADYGIGSNTYGINVYGGEVEGIANAASDTHHGIKCDGTLMVYGGKVKGTGNANGQGIVGKIKSSTSNIKFYFHADGATWGDGAYYGDAVEAPAIRYAKAE